MVGFGPGLPTAYPPQWYLTPELLLALVVGVIGSTPIVPAVARRLAVPRETVEAPGTLGWLPSVAVTVALSALLFASMMLVAARTYNPFIYFRF